MIKLSDYANAFDAIKDFEAAVAKYTGAPYCVTTDCCSHAIEIAFRLAHNGSEVSFPAYTYLSVPMTMHKVKVNYTLEDIKWRESYIFKGSNIWDCARHFKKDMYMPASIQCISFGRTKPLELGRGGCILTDDKELYERASRMRYDGRDIFKCTPWDSQEEFEVGYHYYLKPEDCVSGLNYLAEGKFVEQLDKHFDYPDCRKVKIRD
jgi:dTDP-4-amino-4,6-dideoxygalactose transaminase